MPVLKSEQRNFQINPNSFKMKGVNYKIAKVDIISACRKQCIVLDDRQHCYRAF